MDFRVLEYYLMAAREENITRASRILHVSQPTISRQLSQLEEELGVKLFERRNHNISLTKEGVLFRRRAQELVDLARKTKAEMQEKTDQLSGEIHIGCAELRSYKELAGMIAAFQKKNPQVHFTIHSGNNTENQELLEQGNIDLALFLEPIDLSRYESLRMKETERFGILARKDSPFGREKGIVPGQLVGTRVITIRDLSVQKELANWSGEYAEGMAN
jgi:DNA-binding transcriptional LysR family regulator